MAFPSSTNSCSEDRDIESSGVVDLKMKYVGNTNNNINMSNEKR
jgi:hypothetical protein